MMTPDHLDFQMNCIKHILVPHAKAIYLAENEQVALVIKMYSIIEKYIEDIIDLKWMTRQSQFAIIGGIIINCEKNDKFLPLRFEIKTQ